MDPYLPPALPPRDDAPPPLEPTPPPKQPSRWMKALGPLGVALVFVGKFLAKFKFLIVPVMKFFPLILKTGGTMILSIGVYAMVFGWKYAVGFVLLIFVHECGHLIAARMMRLDVGAPIFIPFMGASIFMKEHPQSAWVEAIIGIGGPVLGTVGALVCHVVFSFTGEPLWLALAYTGYFLNLFNLIPLSPLDGGRICAAISPWLWLPGIVFLLYLMLTGPLSPVLIFILIAAVPQVLSLFWSRTPEQERYYSVPWSQRIIMTLCYFGLAGFLFMQMHGSIDTLDSLGHWND